MSGILSVGEVLIDFTPYGLSDKRDPLFEQNPGGAPANVAAMVAKLGGQASLAAKVGRDGFGEVLLRTLEEIGVDTSGVGVTDEANTTLAFVHLDAGGERSFSFYRKPGADALLEVSDIPDETIEEADILHAGSVSMTEEPARTATLTVIRRAASMGKAVSFDPNIRENLTGDFNRLISDIRSILPLVRYLKVSEEELEREMHFGALSFTSSQKGALKKRFLEPRRSSSSADSRVRQVRLPAQKGAEFPPSRPLKKSDD